MKKSQFGLVFNIIFSFVFSALLTIFVKAVTHQLTFESFCMGMVPAFCINFVLGTFIPLVKMGNAFAGKFVKEDSKLFYFLRMLAIVFVMTALMSALVMFSEMGFGFIPAFLKSFPGTFLYAYVAGCAVFPLLFKLTNMICSK